MVGNLLVVASKQFVFLLLEKKIQAADFDGVFLIKRKVKRLFCPPYTDDPLENNIMDNVMRYSE